MLPWVRAPRFTGGQEMTYGRSLERDLKRFDLRLANTAWANTAQNRADWRKRVTSPRSTLASRSYDAPRETPVGPLHFALIGSQRTQAGGAPGEIAFPWLNPKIIVLYLNN